MAPRNRNDYRISGGSDSTYTRSQFREEFPDDDACLRWLLSRRHPDGILCAACGRVTPHYRVKSRPSFSCQFCGHHVHPTAGTIFHKSSTSLVLWFEAVFLMSSTRCGISAKQLEREIGVTYKTAWRMFRRIRTMLEDDGPLSGIVEMDETYFTPSKKRVPYEVRRRGGFIPGTQVVVGAVERDGRVVARHVPDSKARTIDGIMREFVLPGTTVFTDEYLSYKQLGKKGYPHHRVKHSAHVFVRGNVHTNTIEGFWSLLKRGLDGVHHSVGSGYLQDYVNSYAWRFNHRRDAEPMFLTMLSQVSRATA